MCLIQSECLLPMGLQEWVGALSRPRAEDMILEVSGVDHGRREALELHRSLVAIEEIHSACSGWVRVPSKLF